MNNDYSTEMRIQGIRRYAVNFSVATAFPSVSTTGYRTLVFLLHSDFSGASKSMLVEVQHSDDNTTFDNTGVQTTFSGSDALNSFHVLVDTNRVKQYVRLRVTPAASQGVSCSAILFNETTVPDANITVSNAVL